MKIYHEKQIKNYCRLHAINNLLGYQKYSYTTFNKKCDELDNKNNFPIGFSKNTYTFYNNGGNDNIFGYLLNDYKLNFIKTNTIYIKNNILGYIVFNNNHTWCIKNIENKLYLIDSLKSKPIQINYSYFKKPFYFIQVIKK